MGRSGATSAVHSIDSQVIPPTKRKVNLNINIESVAFQSIARTPIKYLFREKKQVLTDRPIYTYYMYFQWPLCNAIAHVIAGKFTEEEDSRLIGAIREVCECPG